MWLKMFKFWKLIFSIVVPPTKDETSEIWTLFPDNYDFMKL